MEGKEGGVVTKAERSFPTQGGRLVRLAAIELGPNSGTAPVFYDLAACVPTPISRPMPRKCHLKFAGCFTMQIRCKTMRPTGYLAMVVIIFGSANDTRQPGRSFKKIGGRGELESGSAVRGESVPLRQETGYAKAVLARGIGEEPSQLAESFPA